MTNDQRMVDVGVLDLAKHAITELAEEVRALRNHEHASYQLLIKEIQGIISGPGVEPVAWRFRYPDQAGGMYSELYLDTYANLKPEPLYLAAPSAQGQAVPDDAFTDEELDSIQRVLFDNCGPATAKKVRAMLAATPQPPKDHAVPGWQPIETAPKDGTSIFLGRFAPKTMQDGFMAIDRWRAIPIESYTGWAKFNPTYWPPTHWMPLPQPPVQQYDEAMSKALWLDFDKQPPKEIGPQSPAVACPTMKEEK